MNFKINLVSIPQITFSKCRISVFIFNLLSGICIALINVIQYPLLGDGLAYFWPVMYRLTDGIVLALQVTIMSWLYVTLLWKGKKI
jgi:hypothetical protein